MEDVRYFTPDEARALVPRLTPLLGRLRETFHAYRFARQQVEDLRAMFGEDPADVEGHPERAEAEAWHVRMARHEKEVAATVAELNAMGVDVKDPVVGLVDFYARRATGETVLLCYRDGEETVLYWHPLETGFAGRRPLDEL